MEKDHGGGQNPHRFVAPVEEEEEEEEKKKIKTKKYKSIQ
jgi:hypothetical protein